MCIHVSCIWLCKLTIGHFPAEDTFSNHAETLMAYMIAEACSQSHDLLLISAPSGIDVSGNILSRLPMNQSRDPDDKAVVSGQDQRDSTGLKIAWQYGKYLKRGLDLL